MSALFEERIQWSFMQVNHRLEILLHFSFIFSFKIFLSKGTWVARPVERPTSAQVVISRFVGSSPAWGSVLTARSLEPTSDSVSPSLSAPNPLAFCLCLSQKQILKKIMQHSVITMI